jgi:hypothetical protein
MTGFSKLSLSLCVYSAKISVKDLDYITIGELLEPNHEIVSINSNFVHKAYPGFEGYISRPKKVSPSKKKMMATHGYKERKKVGDGTCFQSCLDFNILIRDGGPTATAKAYRMRYFPKSGDIQVFGVKDENYQSGELVVQRFIIYLMCQDTNSAINSSGDPVFSYVEVVSTSLSLLNYKFEVLLTPQFRIDISKLDEILSTDLYSPPFRIVCRSDPVEAIRRISIVLESNGKKTRVIIWPSGKINIMSVASIDDAIKIYDFLCEIFTAEWDNIIKKIPIPDPPMRPVRKYKKRNKYELTD